MPAEPAPQPVAERPPAPLTPQQMPASPPTVVYDNGLLTISANNSTLSDVLNAVKQRTGATVTVPAAASGDRVFLHVGPALPRDAVSRLLSGTNFNYILVGSPQNPSVLAQVIVTPRQAGGAVAEAPPPQNESTPGSRLPGMGGLPGMDAGERQPQYQPPAPFSQPAQPRQNTGGFMQPGGPGPFQPNPAMAPPSVANPVPLPATPGPTGVTPVQPPPQQPKTPEQLMNELKQMQQQQQQQQKPPR